MFGNNHSRENGGFTKNPYIKRLSTNSLPDSSNLLAPFLGCIRTINDRNFFQLEHAITDNDNGTIVLRKRKGLPIHDIDKGQEEGDTALLNHV